MKSGSLIGQAHILCGETGEMLYFSVKVNDNSIQWKLGTSGKIWIGLFNENFQKKECATSITVSAVWEAWHHSLLLMNSFNKTEADVFLCRLCFLRVFPFISLNVSCMKRTFLPRPGTMRTSHPSPEEVRHAASRLGCSHCPETHNVSSFGMN